MSYDTRVGKQTPMDPETPWAPALPVVPSAHTELMPLILEAAGPLIPRGKRPVGRPATLASLHLALAVLWCVLAGWRSQRAVWRRLCTRWLGPFAPIRVTDQAVYSRLKEQGAAILQALFEQVSTWLRDWLTPAQDWTLAPFASQVYVLDESVLDPVKRTIRSLREVAAGDRALLAGRLGALFDVRRQLWVRLEVLPEAGANCKVQARALLEGVPAGCLLLFDLGSYAFEWFDDLTRRGFWWISRWRQKSSFRVQHVLVETESYRERLVQLGAYRTDWAAYTVRLVEFQFRGTWFSYLTNVLDPHLLSGEQIARLYARRWDIEMAFRALKDYLGLRVLWSASWTIIVLQVWACAILAQCFHALQVHLANEVGVEVFEVSLPILIEQVSQQVVAGEPFSLPDLLRQFQEEGRQIALIRPSSRLTPQVPQIPWRWYDWPPGDLVYERPPRYGHRPAGNRNRHPPNACVL